MSITPVDGHLLSRFARDLPHPPRVVVGGNAAVPWGLLRLIDETYDRYGLFMLNAPSGIPDRAGVVHETPFVGRGMRGSARLRYVPARLSQVPLLFGTTCPPDVVCVRATPPRHGRVSLGLEVNILPAAIEACRARGGLVLAQLDPEMPYTFGDGELELSALDGALTTADCEAPGSLTTLPAPDPATAASAGDALARIGELVAARVKDGATLQLGIGRIPDAALARLVHRRDLGIWSEMVSDGLLGLAQAGALATDRQIVTSFALGSRRLYDWLDGNPRVRVLRTETTNAPARIAQNPRMTSINTALQVDLFAQVNASRIRSRIYSGFGGQTDFVVGAVHAEEGQALIALESWHHKADVSTIVPLLDEPTSAFQHTAVITEQGAAEIFGHDERAQARHLIDCAAHPRVRAELWEEARALGLG
ncbi:MAG TPA: acetyl-CoA hydrolase/transferase C-terminal domain-containing protein [Segeticoccus sp.]|uniref:acetyl-CoA hydrolase/transferase family protein n=1 Tax=Segeticoccus sp. TaxID=2706531 RepID=UPI002D7EF2C3|nr:acetyl-CoA hydrolase/transferase C-terminal domain-containing protein [Segeticoccus sp.]HET8599085.1 acetyl-CoA hydrolase/transferase C-terminal domain-containing protein [Segeticoccus sp.]